MSTMKMGEQDIGTKEFLNFLCVACKANVKNFDENDFVNVDLDELISNKLMKRLFEGFKNAAAAAAAASSDTVVEQMSCKTAKSKSKLPSTKINKIHTVGLMNTSLLDWEESGFGESEEKFVSDIVELLRRKLIEILNEGIFDSTLSYLIPSNGVYGVEDTNVWAQSTALVESKSTNYSKLRKKEKKKKNNDSKHLSRNETEVEIHVYDEVKGSKKDFKCSQSLLVSNMGYFSEITKGQKLEDMDISVHCDITIFEWLMKWIKREANFNFSDIPKLDCKNVVPVMVSASFLQMRPLFQDCVHFCKSNLNDVIRFSSNLTCLNDHILKKLSDKLSNTEVQNLKDKKDKIKSRLFTKLITSLNEEEPEKHRGHFASLAYLYFCLNCGKLVTRVSAPYVPCQVQYITIKYNGDVIFNHSRDPKWNINDHIRSIWLEYKHWSNTYWRLWSQCHFLYCYMCRTMYAVAFADCCPYHPQQPHFYPMEQFQTTNSPIGRYPCCGSKAIRYETILMRSGCKLRSHIPKLQTNDDTCIQTIIDAFPELIKLKFSDDNISTFVEDYSIASFDGLYRNTFVERERSNASIFSQKLLKGPLFQACLKTIQQYKCSSAWEPSNEYNMFKPEEQSENTDCCNSIGESENSDASFFHDISISNKQNVTSSCENNVSVTKQQTRNETRPAWSTKYSIRHNQDNQRDFEEIAFQAISDVLLQKYEQDKQTAVKKGNENINYNIGGSYVQIESEWRELTKTKSCSKVKNVKST